MPACGLVCGQKECVQCFEVVWPCHYQMGRKERHLAQWVKHLEKLQRQTWSTAAWLTLNSSCTCGQNLLEMCPRAPTTQWFDNDSHMISSLNWRFRIPLLDDFSARRVIQAVAPTQPRHYVVGGPSAASSFNWISRHSEFWWILRFPRGPRTSYCSLNALNKLFSLPSF